MSTINSFIEAPRIEPVPDGVNRPLWSVMIPTFNCARYLRKTLESVLAQDPGPDQMQIEVVDDCSTKDDPEAVVREVGRGRVAFYRNPKNTGYCTLNFNVCIQRSRGFLVHILHGDDWVLPGFYHCMEQSAAKDARTALHATRCFFADEEGHYTLVTERLPELQLPSRSIESFHYGTPLQFAGVVMRREFYEQHGGFLQSLVHTADWEMWTRAISRSGGIVHPEVLAVYRHFAANDTGRLMQTAENLQDRERLIAHFACCHAGFDRNEAMRRLLQMAVQQELRFARNGDGAGAKANRDFWQSRAPLGFRCRQFASRMRRKLRL